MNIDDVWLVFIKFTWFCLLFYEWEYKISSSQSSQRIWQKNTRQMYAKWKDYRRLMRISESLSLREWWGFLIAGIDFKRILIHLWVLTRLFHQVANSINLFWTRILFRKHDSIFGVWVSNWISEIFNDFQKFEF
jgi:hypothetical protein